MNANNLTKSKCNYGVLTDISKGINHGLGDRSGRTVSMRTAQGLKRVTGNTEMHDNVAEDLAHLGMIGAAAILFSGSQHKNNFLMVIVILLLLGLFICYQFGKNSNV